MCKILKIPRSTYYALKSYKKGKKVEEYEKFSEKVKRCYEESTHRYGAKKIQKELEKGGIKCSIKRVQRHMRRLGIKSILVKKFKYKKNQGKIPNDKENIINRDFKAKKIFEKLVTDITYIYVREEGWTYLACVMDLYDRKIIGYSYGKHITSSLVKKAIENACLNISDTNGIILHSDLGSQYTSADFENYLSSKGIIHSFSRKGNPYDNACIESFHSIIKKELIYHCSFDTFSQANSAIFEFIESWYNRKRIHSYLNYKTPQQVEDAFIS